MKNRQSKKEALLEALLEIVFAVVGLGIGFLIINLFGGDAMEMEADLLILIGTAVVFALICFVLILIHFIKKKKNK